jgi:hypothetical protein
MIQERWVQLLAAFAATTLVRRLSSEARHLIWLGVIAAFLLIPLAWLAAPAVRIGAIPLAPAARRDARGLGPTSAGTSASWW